MASIEERLLRLEKKDEENSAELLRIKRENVNLKLGNADLDKKCLDLELGYSEVSEKLKSLLENIPPSIDEIFDRLIKAESETQRLRSKVDRVTRKNSKQVDKVKETLDSLQKEVFTLRGLQKLLNSFIVKQQEGELEKMVKDLQVKTKAIEDSMATVNNKVKTTNKKLEATNSKVYEAAAIVKATENEIKSLAVSVKTFENDMDVRKKMSFKAHITRSEPLETGKWMAAGECDQLFTEATTTCFDEDSCIFRCTLTGLYGLGLRLKQIGRGMIMARVKINKVCVLSTLTNADGDDCDRCFLHWLRHGDKLSVEVCSLSGKADMDFCQFAGFLIHTE